MGAATCSLQYKCGIPYPPRIFNIGIELNHVLYGIQQGVNNSLKYTPKMVSAASFEQNFSPYQRVLFCGLK